MSEPTPWSVEDSAELYGIQRWGNTFFDLSANGEVTANTLHTNVPLIEIVRGMEERELQMPVLLRIENVLDAQIFKLNMAFRDAIAQEDYPGEYRGVYPIKVNQQAHLVEEIASFGKRFHHGFEVGSKPEMIAALATLEDRDAMIICNGYKDEEFVTLGLQAVKLGFTCVFVLETPAELSTIISESKRLGIDPIIGVRVKSTTQVSGHWNSTSGDRSVFGLNSMQVIDVIDKLREAGMLDCLKLLHCHLGSQIPSIQDIRQGVAEACHYYASLVKEGAPLAYIDLGGGLAVDYTGTNTRCDGLSRNYSLEEYCTDVVLTIKETLSACDVPCPTIVTESGRATVAYSSVLLFNILDVSRFESMPIDVANVEGALIQRLLDVQKDVQESAGNASALQEAYNDAHFYRNEVRELFRRGQLSLRQRAAAENCFWGILNFIVKSLPDLADVPADLAGLETAMADIYYGNFSLFQSLPDMWAIDQLFPVMPIHRLDEKPDRQAILSDITCDCDGKVEDFIVAGGRSKTLPLHSLRSGEDYYLGVFLVGAYQETLGDLHNLFGDTNVVSVRINRDGSFDFAKEIHGDTISDVLSYVEYDPKELVRRYRVLAERAVREGRISARERQQLISRYMDSMSGYTYFERDLGREQEK